jgi:hypothetical protein
MDLDVIPECYVDTNMIETLVSPDQRYNHQKGCGTVAKVMKENFKDDFALGIIDKDKKQLDYLNEFDEISQKGSLILHKHKTRNHFFIQICPAMEKFMINSAKEVGLNLNDFGLSSELNELKKQAKSTTSKEDIRFKKLVKELVRNSATDIKRLQSWVSYLKTNRHKVVIDDLKKI